jgi:acetyl esterase/lipase
MRDGAAFHPDLRRMAMFLPRGAIGSRSYRTVRRLTGRMSRRAAPNIETVSIGPISVRLHHPPAGNGAPRPALLWIHGGGYVIGTAAQDDALCSMVAERLGVLVGAVDYRLAPEHPFPVPLHDCHDALTWLARRPDVDATRVAIGGGSAGGGLAAALALLARDSAEVAPVFQLLTYPMLDDRTVTRDVDDHHCRLWNNKANRFGWQSYLGIVPGAPEVSGLAAPARHDDLSGLPPAWIGVGNFDLFYDEDVLYAERLRAAGVKCEVEVVPGAFHGFDVVATKAAVTAQFREAQLRALTGALGDQ